MPIQCLSLLVLIAGCQGSTLWSWSHETHAKDIHAVLREGFENSKANGQHGIGSNDSLSLAPSPSHDGTYVLRVFYKKGTYWGPFRHKGASFFAQPRALSGHNHTTLALEYEIWFDDSFQWNKGGKLPGLWGGTGGCRGGAISDSCFSARLMWRAHGNGEVYVYVTQKQQPSWPHFCKDHDHLRRSEKYRQIHCTDGYGIQLGEGSFRFHRGKWHKIRQEVHLNSHPNKPGYVKLWVDGHVVIHVTNIIMRYRNSFGIDGMFFSTFYGGHNHSWACPQDTYTYYRNFRITSEASLVQNLTRLTLVVFVLIILFKERRHLWRLCKRF